MERPRLFKLEDLYHSSRSVSIGGRGRRSRGAVADQKQKQKKKKKKVDNHQHSMGKDRKLEDSGGSAKFAIDFFNKLCAAARKDHQALDPLWSDLALPVENETTTTDTPQSSQDGKTSSSLDVSNGSHNSHSNHDFAYYTKRIVLTSSAEKDAKLYDLFRAEFPNFNVHAVTDKSFNDEPAWRAFLEKMDGEEEEGGVMKITTDDPHQPTLLQPNALEMFQMEEHASPGLMYVPRYQFILVELCRTREGIYGRQFRRVLEVFDLQTQARRLENSAFYVSREEIALDALHLLRIQWPSPSPSAFKKTTTRLVPLLKKAANEGCTSSIRSKSQQLLDYWKQAKNLGKISKLIQDSNVSISALQPALQKAGEMVMNGGTMHDSCSKSQGDPSSVSTGGTRDTVVTSNREDDNQTHVSSSSADPPGTAMMQDNSEHANRTRRKKEQHEDAHEEQSPTRTLDDDEDEDDDYAMDEERPQNRSMDDELSVCTKASVVGPLTVEGLTVKGEPGSELVMSTFRKHGVVALLDMTTDLEACKTQAQEALEALVEEQLEPRGLELESDETFELWDARRLPGRRLENQFKILEDPESPIARLSRQLENDLPLLLFNQADNHDFCLDRAGVLHCFPVKKEDPSLYKWQREGTSLFHDNQHDAYSFTVLVPLVDVVDSSGIMEFKPGTHIDDFETQFSEQFPVSQHDKGLRAYFLAGTVVVLDSRLYQRPLRNSSDEVKPMLYFTYTKKWFRAQQQGYFHMNKSSHEAIAVHSELLVMSRLHQLVTGVSTTSLVSVSDSYGHKFFTDRFDLLLLEGLLSDDVGLKATATANIAAILHFCKLSFGDKETMTREFIFSFSQRAYERRAARLERGRKRHREQECDISIEPDSTDSMTVRGLTCKILMEETTLLSKLGFTADENGIAIMLAMLKAHAARRPLGCVGVSVARLEEVFALWWYARQGTRLCFLPGNATSAAERASRRLVVVFIDLSVSNPNWASIIENASGNIKLDVLLVLDPNWSCFCQDPKGGWDGCDYFLSELEACTKGYQSALFLGCAFGASAALRFSSLAGEVVALSPHVDIPNCKELKRLDVPAKAKYDFHDDLIKAVKETEAYICVHYASLCKGQRHNADYLPKIQGVELVAHNTRENDLWSYLDVSGELVNIVCRAIDDFTGPRTPRTTKKVCTGRITPVPSLESCHTNSQL